MNQNKIDNLITLNQKELLEKAIEFLKTIENLKIELKNSKETTLLKEKAILSLRNRQDVLWEKMINKKILIKSKKRELKNLKEILKTKQWRIDFSLDHLKDIDLNNKTDTKAAISNVKVILSGPIKE